MEGYLDPKYVARRRAALAGMRAVPEGTGLRTQVLNQNPYYGMHLPLVDPTNPAIQALGHVPGSAGPSMLAQGAQAYGDSIESFLPLVPQAYDAMQQGLARTSPVPTIASNPGVEAARNALGGMQFNKPKAIQEAETYGGSVNPPINMNPDLTGLAAAAGQGIRSIPGSLEEGLKIVPGISSEMVARDLGYTLRGGPLDHAAKTIGAAEGAFLDAGAGLLNELKNSPVGKAFLEGWRGPGPYFGDAAGGASSAPVPMTASEAEIAQAQGVAQQQDLAASVAGLGGGGVSMPSGGGGYGNLYGLEEPKPLPRPDFSRIEELLSQMQPEAPVPTSQKDMIVAILGGLASGSLSGNSAGSALAGAGAGAVGARDTMLQRERFDQKEFEKETRDFFMTQAQQEMNELQMNGQLDLQDAKARQDFVNTRAQILQSQAALQAQIQMHNSAQAGANARARLAAQSKGGLEGLKGTIDVNGVKVPIGVALAVNPKATMAALEDTLSGRPGMIELSQHVNKFLAGNETAQRQFMMDPNARKFLDQQIGNLAFLLNQSGWQGGITPEVDSYIQNYFNSIYPPLE